MFDVIYQKADRSDYWVDGECFSSYRDAWSYLHIVIGFDMQECHQYLASMKTVRI